MRVRRIYTVAEMKASHLVKDMTVAGTVPDLHRIPFSCPLPSASEHHRKMPQKYTYYYILCVFCCFFCRLRCPLIEK